MNINPEYVETLKHVVKTSPFPDHMSMEILDIQTDKADIVLSLGQCHLQPFGIVHGGVIATLIDTATFWAAFLRLPQDTGLVNVDLKLNYLSSVSSGRLLAKGVCIRPGKSISYAEARVFDDNETLVAHGTSTLMALNGKGLDLGMNKFKE
ncbi:MAG: PaaI family thioesterase [Desulfobacteraceae bacterium]|nr:MAG: PaaI family thioesterase [Desulfobacteraceae bacterium]